VDDAHLMQARRGMISSVVTRPVHPNAVPLHPMAIGAKLSPSQSEPDLANPTRWRSQRRIHDEPSADLRLVFLSTRTQQHRSHVCSSNNRDLWNCRSGTNNEHL
jgi:hypothetical protein